MKHKYLSIIIVFAALSTVACSDDKGGGQMMAGGNTCGTNPTLPGCSLQKAALAQVPGSPEQAALFAKTNPTPGAGLGQAPGTPVVTTGGTIPGTGIAVGSVDPNAIKAKAAKIAAAIKADNENPDSPHYIPPEESGRAPSSVSPAAFQQASARMAEEAPQAVEGGGEAGR